MRLTNEKFLEKIDRGEDFTPNEIISICNGEIGITIAINCNDGEEDEVDRYFIVNDRYFSITYMDDYDKFGREICGGRFDESELIEMIKEDFEALVNDY